jgi:hypothetical protein
MMALGGMKVVEAVSAAGDMNPFMHASLEPRGAVLEPPVPQGRARSSQAVFPFLAAIWVTQRVRWQFSNHSRGSALYSLPRFLPVPTPPGTGVLVTPSWRSYCGIRAGDFSAKLEPAMASVDRLTPKQLFERGPAE